MLCLEPTWKYICSRHSKTYPCLCLPSPQSVNQQTTNTAAAHICVRAVHTHTGCALHLIRRSPVTQNKGFWYWFYRDFWRSCSSSWELHLTSVWQLHSQPPRPRTGSESTGLNFQPRRTRGRHSLEDKRNSVRSLMFVLLFINNIV